MKPQGYPKKEKLKQKKEITLLFEQGKWTSFGRVRIITFYHSDVSEGVSNHRIGFSVSKKNFKKAVDRNRIKRLLREAYRLNKKKYTDAFGNNSVAMLFWASKKFPLHYQEVEKEFLKLCESQLNN